MTEFPDHPDDRLFRRLGPFGKLVSVVLTVGFCFATCLWGWRAVALGFSASFALIVFGVFWEERR